MSLILIIEDERLLAESIAKYLMRQDHQVITASTGEEGVRLFKDTSPDLTLLDYKLPGRDGLSVLREVKEIDRDIPVIMMTAYGTVETAVEAMKIGAGDYIEKPVDLLKLKVAMERLFENKKLKAEVDYHRERVNKDEPFGIIGESTAIKKIIEQIRTLVKYDTPHEGAPTILICGETGVGKGVFAREIHRLSPRSSNQFIEINCTAIPENMIEAELFGYRKGSFTDAKESKAGLMEAAEGGTLFLDEIGHLGMSIQSKLLKLVEEKVVRRLGELKDRRIDVRIIAATNRDLNAARRQGSFREDLYHRLNVIRIDLPPLRDRDTDILLLADHFVKRFSMRYGKITRGFTEEAKTAMLQYAWPGNVREMNNLVERAILLEDVEKLGIEHLGLDFLSGGERAAETEDAEESAGDREGFVLPRGGVVLDNVEKELIAQALERARWNRNRAAKLLGITLEKLRYRMEKYGINKAEE